MRFSVIHPTARIDPPYPSFPEGWLHSHQSFLENCANPRDVEYVLVVHESNMVRFWKRYRYVCGSSAEFSPWGAFSVVMNHGLNTNVAQVNHGAMAAQGEILVGTMDDLFPPKDWDRLISERIGDASTEKVLHCSTGSPLDKDLINAGGVTRVRVQRMGYAVYPGYESMYCDNEFTDVARRDGVVIPALDIEFEHRHPNLGKGEWDAVYRQQNRAEAYAEGKALYLARKARNFMEAAA